jgi:hypothetical protein
MGMLEAMFVVNLINKIKEKRTRECLQLLKTNVVRQNNSAAICTALKEKFFFIAFRVYANNKNNVLFSFRIMKLISEYSKKQRAESMTK